MYNVFCDFLRKWYLLTSKTPVTYCCGRLGGCLSLHFGVPENLRFSSKRLVSGKPLLNLGHLSQIHPAAHAVLMAALGTHLLLHFSERCLMRI